MVTLNFLFIFFYQDLTISPETFHTNSIDHLFTTTSLSLFVTVTERKRKV